MRFTYGRRLSYQGEGKFEEEKHKRDEDGKFATTEGEGGGGEEKDEPKPAEEAPVEAPAAEAPTAEGEGEGETPEPKARKGSAHFTDDQLDRLEALGINGLPPDDATDVEIRIPLDGDTSQTAAITWVQTNKNGKPSTKYGYTAEYEERKEKEKWERIQTLEPDFENHREALSASLEGLEFGSKEHQSATVLAVIAHTGLRLGGDASLKTTGNRGVRTLLGEHIKISADGNSAEFSFIGKSHVHNTATLNDPRVANALSQYIQRAGPKNRMFSVTEGNVRKASLGEGDRKYKPKDFRTMVATRKARAELDSWPAPPPPLPNDLAGRQELATKVVKDVSTKVSQHINNEPEVSRKSYIHPQVWQSWLEGIGVPTEGIDLSKKVPKPKKDGPKKKRGRPKKKGSKKKKTKKKTAAQAREEYDLLRYNPAAALIRVGIASGVADEMTAGALPDEGAPKPEGPTVDLDALDVDDEGQLDKDWYGVPDWMADLWDSV